MKIRAITFDVGGTLIEPWPSVGQIYAEVAKAHGVDGFEPEWLNRQFAAAWRAKPNFDYSRTGWAEIVANTFRLPGQALPEIPFFDALYARFAERETWRIYDDVLPALEMLSERGVKLAVISNWDERLRPLLRQLGLDGYFEFMAISSEVGFPKPSSIIFHEAIRKLGFAPGEILHVGDRPIEDYEGSKAAGMRGMLLSRGQLRGLEAECASLSALGAWLD